MKWKLVNKKGNEVVYGSRIEICDGATVILEGGAPPHKPSSTGRIYVRREGSDYSDSYFPSVCDLEWIELDT